MVFGLSSDIFRTLTPVSSNSAHRNHATTANEQRAHNDGPMETGGALLEQAGRETATGAGAPSITMSAAPEVEEEARPRVLHSMLAGGIGGTCGDMLMHSLDTVKTRQQGDPHIPPRYSSLTSSFFQILRQEGAWRGLYGGWLPALLGSFPGTIIFFGTYESSKTVLLHHGFQPQLSYLASGFIGDLAASVVYVPSEVLKTRLQLQGRYRNPYFTSGYNYRGLGDAVQTMIRNEGPRSVFHGYKATLFRDLPFSALQFMFYETGQTWARNWKGDRNIGWQMELLTGGVAGGLAGTITCPLDVVKTRLQTQLHPKDRGFKPDSPTPRPPGAQVLPATGSVTTKSRQNSHKRAISTSSPSTHTPKPGAVRLATSSIYEGLAIIYRAEGMAGWFRGVGPRAVWTSIQSACMLYLYQSILRRLEVWMPTERPEMRI